MDHSMHATANVVAPLADGRSTDCYQFVASDPSEFYCTRLPSAQSCDVVHRRTPCAFATERWRPIHTALDTCNLLLRVNLAGPHLCPARERATVGLQHENWDGGCTRCGSLLSHAPCTQHGSTARQQPQGQLPGRTAASSALRCTRGCCEEAGLSCGSAAACCARGCGCAGCACRPPRSTCRQEHKCITSHIMYLRSTDRQTMRQGGVLEFWVASSPRCCAVCATAHGHVHAAQHPHTQCNCNLPPLTTSPSPHAPLGILVMPRRL